MPRFDAIVIGGGHNGLVAAAYLAKTGLRTLLIERRGILGGASTSEELWPGYQISTGAYVISLLSQKVVSDLKLKSYGFEVIVKEPQIFVPFPDHKHIFVWSDHRKTLQEIERFSKRDVMAYKRWVETWRSFSSIAEGLMLRPPPDISELVQLIKMSRWAKRLRLKSEDVASELLYLTLCDARKLLEEYFESEEVKAALVEDAVVGTFAGPRTSGTAYVLAHHVIGGINGMRGAWGYVKGGMVRLVDALRASCKSLGVEIATGAEVKRILVKNGRALGVELKDGRQIESKVVLSSVDPKTTFLKLIDEEHIEQGLRRKVLALKSEGVSMKLVGILNGLPRYRAYDSPCVGPQHRASALILPSIDYVDRAYADALHGKPSREPWMSINIHSAVDPLVAQEGTHTLSVFLQYAPYSLKGSWDEIKQDYAKKVIELIEEYAPNIKEVIKNLETITPLDIERRFGNWGGNIFHIDMTPDQLLNNRPLPGLSDYRTPIKGLYLCGASTHPGGGVSGAPGHNAALMVAKDLNLKI
ncbi:MAG: NAD(P)/FAD-dependent oxidoreductase [Nitrososphaerota archaeon]